MSIKNRWPIQLASVNGNSCKAFFPNRVSSLNKASIYLFWVNNGNTRKRHEICPKLIIKTSKGSDWRCSDFVSVRFEHISHCFLLSLIRTLNREVFPGKYLLRVRKEFLSIFRKSKQRENFSTSSPHPISININIVMKSTYFGYINYGIITV